MKYEFYFSRILHAKLYTHIINIYTTLHYYQVNNTTISYVIVEHSTVQYWIDINELIHMRYSYSDRVAQVVERDASNIKAVSSILTAVKVFFTCPVETHSLESTFPNYIYIYPLRKIFNRNTLKLSYSCMPNVKSIISSHNKSVLKDQSVTSASQVDKDCNCRKKDTCPLSGKCLTTNVVYQATVTRDDTNEQETYVGHTECQFKTRYNGHTSSFRNAKYKHATELSKHVWNLNDKNVKYSIKWRVLARCNSYSNKTKRCHLCLHEKYIMIYHPKLASLNSRNELLSKCRHRNKFLLSYM